MAHFLKVFLRGIVCTLLLPVILLVLSLYGVYCLFAFAFMFFKSVILFFMGDSINHEMKEDIEAKKIILQREEEQANAQHMMSQMYQNAMAQMQQNSFQQQPSFQQPITPQNEQNIQENTINSDVFASNGQEETNNQIEQNLEEQKEENDNV